MAALGFFRRRQKLVMILMVMLMIAFLIPTGIRGCFQPNIGKQEVGRAGSDKIISRDLISAQASIEILSRLRQEQPRTAEEQIFRLFLAFNPEGVRSQNWTLLLHEARGLGLKPSPTQAKQLLSAMGMEGDQLQRALAHMGVTEADLARAAEELVLITQSYLLNAPQNLAPSLPEIRHDFRDLREKLNLGLVGIPAENFVKDMPEPSDEQVQRQFEQYRDVPANSPENLTKFGFGYRVPNQLDVQYLAIDTQAVREAIIPTDEQMLALWHQNGDRLIVTTASQPASAPASQPAASEPAELTTVITRFSEAKPALAQQVRAQQTELKSTALLNRARDLAGQFTLEANPYVKAAQSLLRPADDLLAKPVPTLGNQSVTLSELINKLDDALGVRIVYPFGQHEKFFLDGGVKIKIDPAWAGKPLGEVLNHIADAHKYPRLTWVKCDGLDNAIFPSQPIDGAPVKAGGTGMVSIRQAMENPLLAGAMLPGQAQRGPSASLLDVAGSVFTQLPGKNALIHKGEESRSVMVLEEPFPGKMIWRLADYELAHTPKELTPEIRRQVAHDLKLVGAFAKAQKVGEELLAKAQANGNLEQLAKAQNLEYSKTGLNSRKSLSYTGQLQWTSVPGVGINPEFIEQAFKLVPADPDHVGSTPAMKLVSVYQDQKVFVLQRIGYEPVSAQEFMAIGLGQLMPLQIQGRQQMDMAIWFNNADIVRRTDYKTHSGKAPVANEED